VPTTKAETCPLCRRLGWLSSRLSGPLKAEGAGEGLAVRWVKV